MPADDDEARTGLVDLAVLGNYRLVNLAGAAPLSGIVAGDTRLALAAFCDRHHIAGDDEDRATPGPFLLAVADADGASDNLADLAWAAVGHEREHHGGDAPHRRWETGPDLDRLYANTRTLWAGVDDLARALGVTWVAGDPQATLRAAAHRIGQVAAAVEVIRLTLPPNPGPAGKAILHAVDELTGPPEVPPPAPPRVGRCDAVCPRGQAVEIAERAGVVRVDADWRCYLAPHTVYNNQHTVRPTPRGRLYYFTEDGE
jgi:hypothetical protein